MRLVLIAPATTANSTLSLHDALPISDLGQDQRFAIARGTRNARVCGKHARAFRVPRAMAKDRKSTRLNSSHSQSSYAVFCLKKKTPCAWGRSEGRGCPPTGARRAACL